MNANNLKRVVRAVADGSQNDLDRTLKELPRSRRQGESLATLLNAETLEYHMILPSSTEERFARIECEYAARFK